VLPLAYLPPSATTCGSAGVGFATREIVFDTVSGQIASDSYFLSVGGAISELRPEIGSHFVPLVFVLVGTQNFTQPASANGWFCVGQPLAADQGIALAFQQPTIGPELQLAFDLSIENAGGNGDEATAVGTF